MFPHVISMSETTKRKKNIMIWLSPEDHEALKQIARMNVMYMSPYVKHLVLEDIKKHKDEGKI